TITAGLEQTIREWFSNDGGTHATAATETSAKVDATTVKAKARKKHADDHADADHASATAVAAPEAPSRPEPVKIEPARPRPVVSPTTTTTQSIPHAAPDQAKHAPSHAAVTPHAPTHVPTTPPSTPAHAPTLAAKVVIPTEPKHDTKHDTKPDTKHEPKPERGQDTTTLAPAASAPPTDKGAPGTPHTPHSTRPTRSVTPAPMNVPTRPTVISPAGPKLSAPTQVKLSGPKVVRVEAPEVIEAPRPRRTPGPGGAPGGPVTIGRPGGRVGGGAGGAEDDDRGRSPRRKTGPAGKRSTGTGVPERRRASSGEEWVGKTAGIFSEQDLIEREARLLRSGGYLKKRRQDLKKQAGSGAAYDEAAEGRVAIQAPFTIKDLSEATGVKGAEIVKKLFLMGIPATINSGIDPAKAQEIMIDFDIDLDVTERKTAEEVVSQAFEGREAIDSRPRGPVVTILGHVDHGKTSLLDKIRNANVAAGEAGGITQRTSAFRVPIEVEGVQKEIVFLDTPGHEAFTSMRSRGAKMTDVVVLVVSAPEGVMPQTIESIAHAKAANVPLVVALNKIDRADATEPQVQKTLRQLADAGLSPTEWGGDTEIVRVSAVTGQGIKELLEALDYQAQLLELKGDFGGDARGTVIEAKTEEGRGSVASLLVQQGTLKVGDFVVAGRAFGRVRDITDDRGQRVREAQPPAPVQISGLDVVSDAGDRFYVVDSLKKAQEAAEQRRHREREAQLAQPKVTLDNLFSQMSEKDVKEILVVLKAAEQGTVDVLRHECQKVGTSEVKVRVLHAAVGGITESDVLLADASKAIIIGFNVIPSGKARSLAEQKGVEIRTYEVIYHITDDLKKAAEGLLAPELRQEVLGHAEVRQVFKISKVGAIAGCYITDGTVQRDALIRVTRNGIVIENNRRLAQLKRFKDDAKDVRAGMECGMKIDGYDDIKEGDILECYKQVEIKRTL
ncbi:MAG: translation initiation factor IF-2, partial [Phycisphaerae bacterium]|nr:translation initiation factor IF-2 [Phycisphaerae bacterium]